MSIMQCVDCVSTYISLAMWIFTIVLWMVIGIVCAYVVYKDAKKSRKVQALPWALIAFLMPVIGLLIYLLIKMIKTD